MAFSPQTITVAKNTNVIWTNQDSATHTITGVNGGDPGDSGQIGPGMTFTYLFDEPGTYPYRCSIHPNMTGTVIVTP